MMKSMKKMLLMTTIAVMVVSLAAAPAMAHEVQDHQHDPSDIGPVVHDHRDGSSGTVDEEPLKDPGIRLCDITPTECDNTDSSKDEEPLKDPGIRLCDITPTECDNTDDSKDDRSHNSGGHPEANNPNPVKEEDTPSSEGSTIIVDCIDPDTHQLVVCDSKDDKEKGQKDTVAGATQAEKLSEEIAIAKEDELAEKVATASGVPPSPEDGQGYGATVYGCPGGYEYDKKADMCLPDSFGFLGPLLFPEDGQGSDSVGEGIAWFGHFPADLLKITGAGGGLMLDYYIGETLSSWGEEIGGPLGWTLEGLGAVSSFTGEVFNGVVGGLGQVVGYASDGVGEVIDSVADAAEDAWDEISSWF
jgi:hypothetical protein